MEFFKRIPNVDFMAVRKPALIASIIVLLIALGSLAVQGLNLGVDFTGGIVAEVHFPSGTDLPQIRNAMQQGGFPDATVQHFGTPQEALIHLRAEAKSATGEIGPRIMSAVHKAAPDAQLRRVDIVGAQVGSDLTRKGVTAVIVTLALMLLYLGFRFEWRLAAGAIAATFHDIVFLIGFFSIFKMQFDLTVLAAVLAVMGYSVNDTVVVFDRIREDFRKIRRADSREIINAAVNQTLSRTIMTSGLTLLVVIAMLVVGGPVLAGFSLCLLIGIMVGTYSSIYIASGVALMLGVSRHDLMIKKKEDLVDDRP